MVCKRIGCDFSSSMSEMVLEKGLEEDVVDSSGDESGHWCEVRLASGL